MSGFFGIQANRKRKWVMSGLGQGGIHAFYAAIQSGDRGAVKKFLEQGAPVDFRLRNMTALHLAVITNDPVIIELILGNGAAIETKGGDELVTPLQLAAEDDNRYQSAEMLLHSGANVNTPSGVAGDTVLHIAARHGSLRLMKLFLKEEADPRTLTKSGETALHYAVRHRQSVVVRRLIKYIRRVCASFSEAEEFVNLPNRDGYTALHITAQMEIKDYAIDPAEESAIIKALLHGGADTLAVTKSNGELPIHVASKSGHLLFLEQVREFLPGLFLSTVNRPLKNGWTPLMLAAFYGQDQVIDFLLKHGARVDAFDESGKNALHIAADCGSQECCRTLIEQRAFVNAKSKVGITPLHLAAQNGYTELVQFLVKNGATTEAMALDRKTPLHLAAMNGHSETVRALIKLKANMFVKDLAGQTPLHLAGLSNHDEVVKVFLATNPQVGFVPNLQGNTCAHIGATNGSVAIFKSLLKIDKTVALAARNNTTGALPIHLAAKSGSVEIIKLLMDEGASLLDEDNDGISVISQAAQAGHLNVFTELTAPAPTWQACSQKIGFNCLHIAAFYGHLEIVSELLGRVSITKKTEKPAFVNVKDEKLASLMKIDYGFNAVHIAAFTNNESIIRFLLGQPEDVFMQRSATAQLIPLHMAAYSGNTIVAGLLLTVGMSQLNIGDARGMKPLHLASLNGHSDIVVSLIGQGAEIDCLDTKHWTPLHHAASAGRLEVVELLLKLGASISCLTIAKESALSLAAASKHIKVLLFLLDCDFDFTAHLDNSNFVYDLMACTRNNYRLPIQKFILVSKSPLGTAAQLTHAFVTSAKDNVEHAKDLRAAARYTEKITALLMEISAAKVQMSHLLHAVDFKGRQFIDALLEDDLKTVVGDAALQRYMNEVWSGNMHWSTTRLFFLFIAFLICPPVMIAMLLPFPHPYHKIPVIRFFGYFVSNLHFVAILYATVVIPITPNSQRDSLLPTWNELALIIWLGGNLTAELSNPIGGFGLRLMRIINLVAAAIATFLHLLAFLVGGLTYYGSRLMYLRNIILSIPVFISVQMILEFLTFNFHFGPLVISLKYMLEEIGMLIIILYVFFAGFWLQFNTVFAQVCPDLEPELTEQCICNVRVPAGCGTPDIEGVVGCRRNDDYIGTATTNLQILMAAFLHNGDYAQVTQVRNTPVWSLALTRIHFAVFHIFLVLVMLTIVIAVAAETYERLNPHSDLEWMFGRAKLIRDMVKSASTPPPLNLLVKAVAYILASRRFGSLMCTKYATMLALLQERATAGEDEENVLVQVEQTYGRRKRQFTLKLAWLKRFVDVMKRFLALLGLKAFKVVEEAEMKKKFGEHGKEKVKHFTLENVTDWHEITEKFHKQAKEEDSDSETIPELGYSKNDMEEWQYHLWEEMEEIEDEDERRERRNWVIEEIVNVVQSD